MATGERDSDMVVPAMQPLTALWRITWTSDTSTQVYREKCFEWLPCGISDRPWDVEQAAIALYTERRNDPECRDVVLWKANISWDRVLG